MKRTVVAMFPRYQDAELAVQNLLREGVNRDDISIMSMQDEGAAAERQPATDSKTPSRAGAGAMVGGIAGAVLGLTAVAIPGVGPLIAAGPITSILSGAGGGLIAGGLMGAFIGLGVDHDAAKYYADGVQNGGAVVAVHTDEYRVAARLRAMEASRDQGSVEPRSDSDEEGQLATGDAQDPEDPSSAPVKTDTGPGHWAPHNPSYSSSFDEYAGALARDESTLLAGREPAHAPYKEALNFGYQTAVKGGPHQTWPDAEHDLRKEFARRYPGADWDRVAAYIRQGWETARGTG